MAFRERELAEPMPSFSLDLGHQGPRRAALLHGSERGLIGPLSGSLGGSASDSVRFRHPELGHSIEDVHPDHRFPSLSLRRP